MIQRMANRELTSYVRGGDRRVDKWGWDHSKVFYCFIKNYGRALVLCCYFFCLFCPYHANFLINSVSRHHRGHVVSIIQLVGPIQGFLEALVDPSLIQFFKQRPACSPPVIYYIFLFFWKRSCY